MGIKTKNRFRPRKIEEITDIWERYPDLTAEERLFKVLNELVRKATRMNDHTQLPSIGEVAIVINPLFVNPHTKRASADGWNLVRRLVSKINKDDGHPHIRIYTEPHVETVVNNGIEVIRHYLSFLKGKARVNAVNKQIGKVISGLVNNQKLNEDLYSNAKVTKELDRWDKELEAKQKEATRRRKLKQLNGGGESS
jgi:hypothetical protein